MMRSLYSAVSGLKGHQTRMDVIGNNVANVNTTGFKSSRTTFADTLSQTLSSASAGTDTLGGTNPKQIGLGVGVASIDTIFTDGNTQSTGKNTDLALSGNGLFVVKNGNQTYYTRDGAFEFDANGNYVLPSSGLKVQGWNATNGVISSNGATEDIVVQAGKSMASAATSIVTYANNLNSAALTIASISGGNVSNEVTKNYTSSTDGSLTASKEYPVTLTLSDGSTVTATSGSYSVGTVYSTNTSGDTVTMSSGISPVTVNLANTLNGVTSKVASTTDTSGTVTVNGTTKNLGWQYGYTSSTAGDSATASSNQTITITATDGTTLTATSGTTVTVGEVYNTGSYDKTSGTSYTASEQSPLVLQCEDGTTHTVTNGTYVIGTDTYTYPGTSASVTSKVTGITKAYTVQSMNVMTTGGTGSTVSVGGKAYYSANSNGTSMTAAADTPVTITLPNGYEYTATSGTFTIDGTTTYTTPKISTGTSTAAGANNTTVKVYLADGTEHDDSSTNTQYSIGDTYTYTDNGVTKTTTVSAFSYVAAASVLTQSSDISSIDTSATINGMKQRESISTSVASSDNPVILTMSDGSTVTETSGTYSTGNSLPVTTMVTVYDTLGNSHSIPIYFTKTSTDSTNGNSWTVSVDTNGSGKATLSESDGTTTTVTMDDATIGFTTSGAYRSGSPETVTLTLTNGSEGSQTVTLNLQDLTQYAGNSTINGTADGHAAGTLSSVSIDSSGVITGTYTNDVKQTEAQVAVAQFTNASGLEKTGNSLYQQSNNSGTANVKTASDLGVKITPSALEMSNVDIADQFTDMIVTQRGFQSNSKIITVDDELLETVINMKR